MKTLFKTTADKQEEDTVYTKKINIPQYLPSDSCPNISELSNIAVYGKLLQSINTANVTEEEKRFLRFAATRHIVFNYAKIADYYAHANPEMQKLMEESALIILDVNDAISYGYAKFSNKVSKLLDESGDWVNE